MAEPDPLPAFLPPSIAKQISEATRNEVRSAVAALTHFKKKDLRLRRRY
jgi:hypothetical protein